MIDKLYILSTKHDNLRIVLANMAYGADITRPEQRGLLAARRGDIALLFDIDERRLIGPFRISTDPRNIATSLWSNSRWRHVIGLEPLSLQVGVLEGRSLLDLVIERGRLSLRDPMSLITYWIHTLLLDEANSVFTGFLDKAGYTSIDNLAITKYNTRTSRSKAKWLEESRPLEDYICGSIRNSTGRYYPEYILEASLTLDKSFTNNLTLPLHPHYATGVYVYSNRFLDIALYSRSPEWFTVIEVKQKIENSESLAGALEQVSYYAYSISKAFRIPPSRIQPVIVTQHINQQLDLNQHITKASRVYGLRADLYTIIEASINCTSEGTPKITSQTVIQGLG